MTATTSPPLSPRALEQQAALIRTRRRAGALLAGVTVLFLVVTIIGADGWLAYVQATAEAAMVGGLADWFAVTALFRHPLGIPIPHTAIIPERKDKFGETLGSFISESFLTPDAIIERLRTQRVTERAVSWLATPANAARVSGYAIDGALAIADLLKDDEMQEAIDDAIRSRVDAIDLAGAAGRAIHAATAEGRSAELIDAALRGLNHYLDENRDNLHARFEESSPWWLPGAVEDRLFGRIVDGARSVLDDMVNDRGHELRRHLDERIAALADGLQNDPELRERGERLKQDLLAQPELRAFTSTLWTELKTGLRAQSADPDSALRSRLTNAIATTAQRFADEPMMTAIIQQTLERGVTYVLEHFDGEISSLISSTISRWDGEETSRRLELLLGPDLQFIRINGTVVGGGAGLILHSIAELLH